MTDFTDKQKKDIAFFRNHLGSFLNNKLLRGKHVVVSNEEIAGCFDSFEKAIEHAVENFEKGSYIIQEVADPREINNFIRAAVV